MPQSIADTTTEGCDRFRVVVLHERTSPVLASGFPVLGSIPPHKSRNVSLSILAPWRTIVPPVDHQVPPPSRT